MCLNSFLLGSPKNVRQLIAVLAVPCWFKATQDVCSQLVWTCAANRFADINPFPLHKIHPNPMFQVHGFIPLVFRSNSVYVYLYIRVWIRIIMYTYVRMYIYMLYMYVHVCMVWYGMVCMYVCLSVCLHVCLYVMLCYGMECNAMQCMNVCMYVCMHACMYVCM